MELLFWGFNYGIMIIFLKVSLIFKYMEIFAVEMTEYIKFVSKF